MILVKPTVESLQNKAAKITNVFSKTVQELSEVNAQIEREQEIRHEQIINMQRESEQLEVVRRQNTKLISNIKNLFN